MRVAAHRGTRLHAPENSRNALISGYTAGADVLEFDVQLTKDGHVVISHDGTTDRLTGVPGVIIEMTLKELRALDYSETFTPRGAAEHHYFNPKVKGRKLAIETLPDVLDVLPEDVEILLELKHDSSLTTGRRDEFVRRSVEALTARGMVERVTLYSKDPENLRLARSIAPDLRIAVFDYEKTPDERLALLEELDADGLVTEMESVIDASLALTDFGRKLEALFAARKLAVGAVLYPRRTPAVFTQAEYDALRRHDFVWSLSTDSMLDVAPFVRRSVTLANLTFNGKTVDREHISLGYAKANKYGHVFQDDGVHVKIDPWDGPQVEWPIPEDPLERRLWELEEKLTYTAKDWPYYSGGGLGLVRGIRGYFSAEVDYTVENVAQATTLEMAVLNVDPGAHQAKEPATFRDKDSFFDPHGAPPYVGVEHDEDDGYRINWNLGSEYDNNQYGRPAGDGATPRAARLRLERRGPYFAAYYRNSVDAPDWVCVGVARNDSLNPVVYLRCAGKRWRQESEADPTKFSPIIPNHFTFKNLLVTRYI